MKFFQEKKVITLIFRTTEIKNFVLEYSPFVLINKVHLFIFFMISKVKKTVGHADCIAKLLVHFS